MKQHTSEEQTAKLIELGFEKPTMKNIPTPEGEINEEWYSIGELIKILGVHLSSIYYITGAFWVVNAEGLERSSEELVDALYDMIIKLKNEEVL